MRIHDGLDASKISFRAIRYIKGISRRAVTPTLSMYGDGSVAAPVPDIGNVLSPVSQLSTVYRVDLFCESHSTNNHFVN